MSKIPDVHFDARYGWFRFTPTGRIKTIIGEPFGDRDEAITYALDQLRRDGRSLYSAAINAQQALEWVAAAKGR